MENGGMKNGGGGGNIVGIAVAAPPAAAVDVLAVVLLVDVVDVVVPEIQLKYSIGWVKLQYEFLTKLN